MASFNAQQQAAAKKKNTLALVGVIVAAVLVIGLCVFNTMSTNGFFLRHKTAAQSEHFKVSNAVTSYLFNSEYQSFLGSYGMYASYFGLDSEKSLKTQPCSFIENGTWFDYFMTNAHNALEQYMYYAEEAHARGLSLTAEDKTLIDSTIDSIAAAAEEQGVGLNYYISTLYGTGMKKNDVKEALELIQLASKGYKALKDELDITDADIKAYASDQGDAMKKISYMTITIGLGDAVAEGNLTDAMITDYAKKFKSATTQSAFEKLAKEYYTAASKGDDYYTELVEDTVKSLTVEYADYNENDEFSVWAYNSSRKVGDVYTVAGENGEQTISLLLQTKALDTRKTVNVRHILINADEDADAAKAKADEILAEYKAGAQTADAFGALANKYSADAGSNTNGGLYENVRPGEMVQNFNDWCFDSSRKVGDTGIVESDYGYHVMFLDALNGTVWEADAKDAITSERMEGVYETLTGKYSVTLNEKVINSLAA